MAEVDFWYIKEGAPYNSPKVSKTMTISKLLSKLFKEDVLPKGITIYKFPTPLRSEGYGGDAGLVGACFAARATWIKVEHVNLVGSLADDQYLSDEYVCLVIELPKGQHDQAVDSLKVEHTSLFKCLQIQILNIHSFSWDDVLHNMAVNRDSDDENTFWGDGVVRMNPVITQLETELAAKRTFHPPAPTTNTLSDFTIANRYGDQFVEYFTAISLVEGVGAVVDNAREFIAFFALFRCHAEDAGQVSNPPASSHMKANHLATHFLLPPFSICRPPHRKTTFHTELPWKFPIFLATRAEPAVWSKFTPNSDFSVCVDGFLCPLLVCEVISDKGESDRWRMLLQGIALARVVHRFKKPESSVPFFVAAVYLRSNLTAERFIIMQTDPTGKVAIAQRDYDLKKPDHSRDFLKEMYNLQIKLDDMTAELDDVQKGALMAIAKTADPIMSLSRRRAGTPKVSKKSKSSATGALDPITESAYDITQDPEVLKHLTTTVYQLQGLVPPFKHIASVFTNANPHARGFIKFTSTPLEVEILQLLMKINDPHNHTISGAQVWPRSSGGYVIYTPSGGEHLNHLLDPDKHVWSAAKQLIEGVAFMHKHHVAHLDIKPANVVIPFSGGRLSIIDFSFAVLLKTPGQKVCDNVGTEGYIAPEVELAAYDPIRADLWSCGKTLHELTLLCRGPTNSQKALLVSIAHRLMSADPQGRPTMSEVLDLMVDHESPAVAHPRPDMRCSIPSCCQL